jgi:protoporphyrinogen oxidase
MPPHNLIIIGAGISGLSFAHNAQAAGHSVQVLEKQSRVGGLLHSAQVAPDFWLELGGHTCYNSYTQLLELLNHCHALSSLQPREEVPYYLWRQSQFKSIPSQLHYLDLLTHLWRLPFSRKDAYSLREYYSKTFGAKNFDDVLQHAFSAVLSQPADEYPASLLFNKRPARRKDISRKFSVEGGLESIAKLLATSAPFVVEQEVEVFNIEYTDHFVLNTSRGSYQSKQLALATDLPTAQQLMPYVDHHIAQLLNQIQVAHLETIAVAFSKTASSRELHAGLIGIDAPFYSSVSRDIISHPHYRGVTFHFKPNQINKEEKIRIICDCLNIKEADILYLFEKNQALPALKVGHEKIIKEIDQALQEKPYFLLGNYFQGIAIEDCLSRSRKEWMRLKLGSDQVLP